MELQERLVLAAERDNAVKSKKMLRILLLNQPREEGKEELAIIAT